MSWRALILVCACAVPFAGCGDVSEREALEAGQCLLVGTVVDGRDGAPIAGATVTFEGAHAATTDEEGRFHLEPVQAGAAGLLRAIKDGRGGEVPVRALQPGQLNVVIHL